ncbi:MAG TPA: FAD:protein FMN transferase [Longimicrobiales bacterium]|nr:FAD:protein FMN transferase [Longimicrobiales bacterium]
MTAVFAALLAFAAGPLQGVPDCAARLEREMAAMGTTLRVQVCAQSPEAALAATEAAFAEVRRLNGVLSSWTLESEVGRLNSGRGRVAVSTELFALLSEVGRWVAQTGGAFDPAVGALVDAWQVRGPGRTPSAEQVEAALELTGWRHLQLLDSQVVVRGPAGWWLDTGGFGKGAALRSVAAVLRRAGVQQAEVDFGGQLLILGQERVIAVAHPRARQHAVVQLKVRDVSVSTSSQSERSGHILDPRTGKPVAPWGSVTVVATDALVADALSTALFVMGPHAALDWARKRPDIGVLILENTTNQPRVTWNAAMSRFMMESH